MKGEWRGTDIVLGKGMLGEWEGMGERKRESAQEGMGMCDVMGKGRNVVKDAGGLEQYV